MPETCRQCAEWPISHDPIPDDYCASCGKTMARGCPLEHHHSAWLNCVDIDDIRELWCGCYGHKSCQKAGNVCREHGAPGDAVAGSATFAKSEDE